jgi:divalent metal cation (Fe/Co/Zn/Cd) transporter
MADSSHSLASPQDRIAAIRRGFSLEWLSVAWMSIEAIVAASAGMSVGSLTLTAFGLDSVIELLSAGVLIWRLTVELRRGQDFSERTERLASRISGGLLFALATYILIGAAWSVATRHGGAFSVPGLVVAILAMPIMYFLARRKLEVAETLGSRAMRADAVESITCGWLSLVVVIGQVADVLIGAWWVDPLASLGILWFVIREAREAWAGAVNRHAKGTPYRRAKGTPARGLVPVVHRGDPRAAECPSRG